MTDMKKTEIRALIIALILAILGAPTLPGLFQAGEIQTMAEGDTNFTNVVASGDITAGDDLAVGDDTTMAGDLTISGTTTWGITSPTLSDNLTLTGTLTAEDAVITDTLDVNGDIDLDGDGFDVNITAGFSIDADAASNINVAGAGIDLALESELGRLILKADEAAATAVHIDANDATTTGLTIDVGSVSGLLVNGGVTNIGGGTPAVATGDNDLYVTADLEVDGELELDGALDADSTANIQGAVTLQSTASVGGALTLSALLYPSVADETITNGETLTPTVTVYNLGSGGAVTMTLAAAGTEGQPLILCGNDANTITINDTNVRTNNGGVQTIGQYDCITWVYIDSEWLELSESNNS